jgi:hypothetical protein
MNHFNTKTTMKTDFDTFLAEQGHAANTPAERVAYQLILGDSFSAWQQQQLVADSLAPVKRAIALGDLLHSLPAEGGLQ